MGINTNKTQAIDAHNQDFAKKVKHEKQLTDDLIDYYIQIADDYSAIYQATGEVINLGESYEQELTALLLANYRPTAKDFKYNIRNEIKPDEEEEPIPQEVEKLDNTINMAIGAYLLTRANAISPQITATAQQQLTKKTEDYIVNKALDGIVVTNSDVARDVGNDFKAWGRSHAPTVATTEIQNVAEHTKGIEANTLNSALVTQQSTKTITKRYITAGDEKVRQSHADADFQVRNENEPFTLGSGFHLMFPSDQSLGAPLKEVINCRCSSVYVLNNEIIKIVKGSIFRRKK